MTIILLLLVTIILLLLVTIIVISNNILLLLVTIILSFSKTAAVAIYQFYVTTFKECYNSDRDLIAVRPFFPFIQLFNIKCSLEFFPGKSTMGSKFFYFLNNATKVSSIT